MPKFSGFLGLLLDPQVQQVVVQLGPIRNSADR